MSLFQLRRAAPRGFVAVLGSVWLASTALADPAASAPPKGSEPSPFEKSRQEAERRYREQWSSGEAIRFTKEVGDGILEESARSCEELLWLNDEHYEPAGQTTPEFNVFSNRLNECEQFRLLLQARPAIRSYLKDFAFRATSAQELPAGVALLASNDFDALLKEADATGTSLASFYRAMEWKLGTGIMKDGTLHLEEKAPGETMPSGWTDVEITGRGDFNGDGLEDLLLSVSSNGGGSMTFFGKRLVTRLPDQKVMTLLEPGVQQDAVAPSGCSGDEIDLVRNDYSRKFGKNFSREGLSFLENAIQKCAPRAASIQMLWLYNDAVFVAFKVGDLQAYAAHLAKIDALIAAVDDALVPDRLRKAITYNRTLGAPKK